jgi:hypothetical protein
MWLRESFSITKKTEEKKMKVRKSDVTLGNLEKEGVLSFGRNGVEIFHKGLEYRTGYAVIQRGKRDELLYRKDFSTFDEAKKYALSL